MNIDDLTRARLIKVLTNRSLDLPEFLTGVRKAYGRSRIQVCRELELSPMRLFCLEHGNFLKPMMQNEIEILSEYYKIDMKMLQQKAAKFIADGLGKSQFAIGEEK